MPGLSDVFQETHRRAVWQVMGTYLASAWVALQVIEVLMETIGLPTWVPKGALILLLAGVPVVLATAIIQGATRGRSEEGDVHGGEAPEPGARVAAEAGRRDEGGADTSGGHAEEPAPRRRQRLFTWRNLAVGGGAAFALLGLVTAGWMAMRALGIGPAGSLVASGVIEEGERIIVADLDGDPALAEGATLALRVDLDESDVVSTVDPSFVASTLELMQRSPDARLDATLAREVAVRLGTKAVLEGEITPLGSSHVLTVRLVAAENGSQLASFKETAGDADDLLDAIDRLSRKLRERLGESLRSIHASEPLADVTTGSLPALQKYSQAWAAINAGNDELGVTLLEDALALDSTFAMAWRKLATVTSNERRVEAATKAYQYRDRLTDRERYHTLGIYHTYATGDLEAAATAYRTLIDAYPNDAVALNNLGVTYGNRREWRLAAEMYTRAMEADPLTATYPQNAHLALFRIGMADSAGAILDAYASNLPDHAELPMLEFRHATAVRDLDRARSALARRLQDQDLNRLRFARLGEGLLVLLEGKLGEAERIWDQLATDDAPEDRLERSLERAAELHLRVAGDTAAAIRDGLAALERYDIRELPAPDWPMDDVLFLFGEAGRPDLVRQLATEWIGLMERAVPNVAGALGPIVLGYLDAQAVLHGDDPARGVAPMREVVAAAVENNNCDSLCVTNWLATAHDLAGQADSAIVWYERYLDVPDIDRLEQDAQVLHRVLMRLGELNDALGRFEEARRYYGEFEQLWSEADPRLMPRVDRVRTRLGELLEATG